MQDKIVAELFYVHLNYKLHLRVLRLQYFSEFLSNTLTSQNNRRDQNNRKMGVDRDNIVVDTKPRSEKMDNSKVCLLLHNHAAETNIVLEAQSVIVDCHPAAK
jgi:hypothetical protein